ncbi:MAG: hypothetical protein GY953_29210, partial [bacterium]|nr:hypothetical protein [bacterium]
MHTELRQILRRLTNAPGFTAIVILTLALGIGANTAVFSLFDQVILRLLPVRDPGKLVLLESSEDRLPGWSFSDNHSSVHSYPAFRELREGNTVFTDILARSGAPASLSYKGSSERVDGELVSGNFFDVLGVSACRGSTFHGSENAPDGSQPLVVLSHGFWSSRFGARDEMIGEKITLNGHPL